MSDPEFKMTFEKQCDVFTTILNWYRECVEAYQEVFDLPVEPLTVRETLQLLEIPQEEIDKFPAHVLDWVVTSAEMRDPLARPISPEEMIDDITIRMRVDNANE